VASMAFAQEAFLKYIEHAKEKEEEISYDKN
jgi:hypothetical protein